VDLCSEYPSWSLPTALIDPVREAFGPGWDVSFVSTPSHGRLNDDDSADERDALYQGAETYFGWGVRRRVLRAASETLRWAHTGATGAGASITPEFRNCGAVLTNSRGIHAEPVSDWVVAAIGFCARGFHTAVNAQGESRWAKRILTTLDERLVEFSSLTVGIVGLGGIGTAIARKCAALGMEVRAIRRASDRASPTEVVWLGGPEDLPALAAESDVLVLALPHTSSTAGLVDESTLGALPRGSYVLNVSRGGILDEAAVLKLLDDGHLGGCVLDVFAKEPLEPEHPFWKHPGVFVTPHVSAVTDRYWEREVELIVDNVGRYLRGDRLRNVVNLEAGY